MAKKKVSPKRKRKPGGGRKKKAAAIDRLPDPSTISDSDARQAAIDRRIVELRLAGKTYRAIGDELGVPKSTVYRVVDRVLVQERAEAAAGLDTIAHDREVEAARLDLVLQQLMNLAGFDKPKLPTASRLPKYFWQAVSEIGKYHDRIVRLRGLEPTADNVGMNAEDPLTTAMRQWPVDAQKQVLQIFVQQQNLIVNGANESSDGNAHRATSPAITNGGRGPGNFPAIPKRDYVT